MTPSHETDLTATRLLELLLGQLPRADRRTEQERALLAETYRVLGLDEQTQAQAEKAVQLARVQGELAEIERFDRLGCYAQALQQAFADRRISGKERLLLKLFGGLLRITPEEHAKTIAQVKGRTADPEPDPLPAAAQAEPVSPNLAEPDGEGPAVETPAAAPRRTARVKAQTAPAPAPSVPARAGASGSGAWPSWAWALGGAVALAAVVAVGLGFRTNAGPANRTRQSPATVAETAPAAAVSPDPGEDRAGASAAVEPPVRTMGAMAGDTARGVVVLFGGRGAGPLADTWEWNGTAWTCRSPADHPSPRLHHVMAYDQNRKRVVLFGGSAGGELQDTWEWDGTNWLEASPGAGAAPGPRAEAAMVYWPSLGRTVLFGGRRKGQFLDDTWTWDGHRWEQLQVAGPPPRCAAMLGDAGGGKLLLFGGMGDVPGQLMGMLADSWEFDGSAWSRLASSGGPVARSSSAMLRDEAASRLVLAGGSDGDGNALGDTWEWNTGTWRQVDCSPELPPVMFHPAAYDAKTRSILTFVGTTKDAANGGTWQLKDGGWRHLRLR